MRKKFLAQIILVVVVAAFGLTGCKNKTATGSGAPDTSSRRRAESAAL